MTFAHLLSEDETYLKIVENWKDPNPAPVIEKHEGIFVVRDDLLEVGSKARFIDYMVGYEFPNIKEWVYAAPRQGFGQLSLAYVANRYGKSSKIFLACSKEPHEYTVRAQKYGAKIQQVVGNQLAFCKAACKSYANNRPSVKIAPFGLAAPSVFGSIIKVARAIPFVPDEVWTVAGSGTINRGLQLAWPNAKCVAVSVGHKLTDVERGRATVIEHELDYAEFAEEYDRPPFPSVPNYDAKAWKYVKQLANKKKKVLFWNVAG